MADYGMPYTPPGWSPDDFDKTVRTVWGEEPTAEGQRAVASVIANRARASGQSPAFEVMKPGQFEPWSARRKDLEALDPSSPDYQRVAQNILPVLTGQADDPTGGATHFYAPKAQAALGRPAPSWDNGAGVDIGKSRFFKLPYGGAPLGAAPDGTASPDIASTLRQGTRPMADPVDFSSDFGDYTDPAQLKARQQRLMATSGAFKSIDPGTGRWSGLTGLLTGLGGGYQLGSLNSIESDLKKNSDISDRVAKRASQMDPQLLGRYLLSSPDPAHQAAGIRMAEQEANFKYQKDYMRALQQAGQEDKINMFRQLERGDDITAPPRGAPSQAAPGVQGPPMVPGVASQAAPGVQSPPSANAANSAAPSGAAPLPGIAVAPPVAGSAPQTAPPMAPAAPANDEPTPQARPTDNLPPGQQPRRMSNRTLASGVMAGLIPKEAAELLAKDPRQKEYDAYDEKMGASLAKDYTDIKDSAQKAVANRQETALLRQIAANPATLQGWGSSLSLGLRRVAEGIGIKTEGATPTQVFQALMNKHALEARSTAEGTGMPGSMSDADRAFLAQIAGGIANTPEANIALLDIRDKTLARQLEVARMANRYANKNGGRLDINFHDQLAAWAEKHPLFSKDDVAKVMGQAPEAETAAAGAAAAKTAAAPAPQAAAAQPPGPPKTPDYYDKQLPGTIESFPGPTGEPVRMRKREDGKWTIATTGDEAAVAFKGIGQDIANGPAARFFRSLKPSAPSQVAPSQVAPSGAQPQPAAAAPNGAAPQMPNPLSNFDEAGRRLPGASKETPIPVTPQTQDADIQINQFVQRAGKVYRKTGPAQYEPA